MNDASREGGESCTCENDVLARVADPSCCGRCGLCWTAKCGTNNCKEYIGVWAGWEIQAAEFVVARRRGCRIDYSEVMVVGLAHRAKVPGQWNVY